MKLLTRFQTLAQNAKSRWKRFSATERHQLVGALCFMMTLCYSLLIWMPDNKKLGELDYKEQKLHQRLRSAGKVEKELKKTNVTALNPQAIQRDLARARESLERQQAEQKRLLARFVPPEDLASLQKLKSELTSLAENDGMEITTLEHIYRRTDDRNRPPTPELLKESQEANPYKRPLLRLKARASFRGLMKFLDGLSRLSHIAAPVWSDIEVKSEAGRRWLDVEIRLAI